MEPLTWIAIALAVASFAITALTAKGPQSTKPNSFKDFQFPVPDEGTPQAVIFGDCWTSDWQVLWVGNYRTEEIHAQSGGGKK